MSIDMKSYMGEHVVQTENPPIVPQVPAAREQESVDTNSYQAQEEYPVPDMPASEAQQEAVKPPEPPVPQEDPQERNFRALSAEVDRIKAERETEKREHQLQLDMLRANRQPQQEQSKPQKMFDHMQDTEVPNVGEIRKAWEQKESDYQARIEELQVASRFSDYAEVVEKFAAPLVNEKPHLIQGVLNSPNKAQALYELGKMAQALKATQTPGQAQKIENAQRIVENARKPGTLGQAGGQTVLSKADYYASMSDKQFAEIASKHLGEI